jgi:hypothetical protein
MRISKVKNALVVALVASWSTPFVVLCINEKRNGSAYLLISGCIHFLCIPCIKHTIGMHTGELMSVHQSAWFIFKIAEQILGVCIER